MSLKALLVEIGNDFGKEFKSIPFPKDIKHQFAVLQLRYIWHLLHGVVILNEKGELQIVGCFFRPLIEAYLNVQACFRSKDFAASKCVSDISKQIKHMKVLRKNTDSPKARADFDAVIAKTTSTMNNLIEHHKLKKARNWNAREIAELGDAVPFYENAYPFFHPHVHSGLDAMIPNAAALWESLLFDMVTAIAIDMYSVTIHEFKKDELPTYEAKIKNWQERRSAAV